MVAILIHIIIYMVSIIKLSIMNIINIHVHMLH